MQINLTLIVQMGNVMLTIAALHKFFWKRAIAWVELDQQEVDEMKAECQQLQSEIDEVSLECKKGLEEFHNNVTQADSLGLAAYRDLERPSSLCDPIHENKPIAVVGKDEIAVHLQQALKKRYEESPHNEECR